MPAFFHQQYGCFEWLYSSFSSGELFLLQLQSCSGHEWDTNNIIQKHVSHLCLFFKEWFNNFHHQEELVNNFNKTNSIKKSREFGGPKFFFWRHSQLAYACINLLPRFGKNATNPASWLWRWCPLQAPICPKTLKVLHHLKMMMKRPPCIGLSLHLTKSTELGGWAIYFHYRCIPIS